MKEKRCFGSVRYADGEYAAEQPQGLPAVIAAPTRWAAQTLAGANISIGNPRRIAARRKRQTEAPDHKMQDNKGQATQALARKKKRIKWRHGEEAKERFSSLQAASNNGGKAVAR